MREFEEKQIHGNPPLPDVNRHFKIICMSTIVVKVECDYCDGCGWYEGGPTLMTTCEKCGGNGFVEEERETPRSHKWVIGEWEWEGGKGGHYSRSDKCSLCGCERGIVKQRKADKGIVAHYTRSHQIFGHDHIPTCWGSDKP